MKTTLHIIIVLLGLMPWSMPAEAASVRNMRSVDTVSELLTLNPRAISRDGQATLYVSGLNRTNEFALRAIVYDANSSATTNGAVFGSTNWTGRWLFPDRLDATQRIEWWGGRPDVSDNTAALTNAAAWVASLGGGYVEFGAGTFHFLSGGIAMPSSVRLRGQGQNATTLDFTSATPAYDYEPVMIWQGTVSDTVRLASVPVVGDRTIVLSTAVDWAWDEWIQISNTNLFSFGSRNYYKDGEFNFVYENFGGTNITLMEPLESAYPTAPTTIQRITPTVGSAEQLHVALGTRSGPVRIAYADSRSYFRDCSGAGSEYAQFSVQKSHGVTVSNCRVEWDSDPSSGLGYGFEFGDSEHLAIGPGNFFRAARHGITSGGSTIPTRYCRIFQSTFGSTRQNVAGADMHGDVVDSVFDGCTFLSGLTLGGGRNTVMNSTVMNGRGYPALAVGECRYYDWKVINNTFKVSSFDDEAENVWGMRFLLGAGSQSGVPASTNYWPGTFGGTKDQKIEVRDNWFYFTGIRTNANYGIYIDEASTLTANTNLIASDFGGVVIRGNHFIPSPDQAFAKITSPGIYVQTQSKIRFRTIDISDNPELVGCGVQVRVHSGTVLFNRNVVTDMNTEEGVFILPMTGYALASAVDVEAVDNTFHRPLGAALSVYDTTGRVIYRGNKVNNHGSTTNGTYRFALIASESSGTIGSVDLVDNVIQSTNSPSYDVYVNTAAGTLREARTVMGGSVTTGSRSAGGGYLSGVAMLSTNGLVARTGASTSAARQIAAGTGITITNGDGVSGNPVVALSTNGVTAGTYTNATVTVDAYGRVTSVASGAGVGSGTGTATLARFIPQDGEPPASSYATFSTRNGAGVMLFDSAVQEAMRFRFTVPQGATATTATVILKWTTSATSGDGRWGARMMSWTGDIDSDSFGSAVEATTTTSATAGTIMTTTLLSVSLDGAAAGDQVVVEIYRDVSDAADTVNSNDLELHGIEVRAE